MAAPDNDLSIVAIGGGTGLPVLLRGLKRYTDDVTAIVSVADDGGSSGRLRDELGIIPPGDIRNCLVALMDDGDPVTAGAFQHRFDRGSLAGHTMGNIFLAAVAEVMGDYAAAVAFAARLLGTRGMVIPASLGDLTLRAQKEGGTVSGQAAIMAEPGPCRRVWLEPADAGAPAAAVAAIRRAGLIVIGPGSLYTSVIPNLLIGDIREALATASCPRVFVCNVMTQPGETDGFGIAEHVKAVIDHAGADIIDTVVVNEKSADPGLLEACREAGAEPVAAAAAALELIDVTVCVADVVLDGKGAHHDSDKLAAAVMSVKGPANCRSLP